MKIAAFYRVLLLSWTIPKATHVNRVWPSVFISPFLVVLTHQRPSSYLLFPWVTPQPFDIGICVKSYNRKHHDQPLLLSLYLLPVLSLVISSPTLVFCQPEKTTSLPCRLPPSVTSTTAGNPHRDKYITTSASLIRTLMSTETPQTPPPCTHTHTHHNPFAAYAGTQEGTLFPFPRDSLHGFTVGSPSS